MPEARSSSNTARVRDTAATVGKHRDHPLVRRAYFMTMPADLLELVHPVLRRDAVDPELWDMEVALSAMAGDHRSVVGFRDGSPIRYHLLRRAAPVRVSDDDMRWLGWDGLQIDRALDEASDTLGRVHHQHRAYAGWLMSNPEFVNEQHAYLTAWAPQVQAMGIPIMGPVLQVLPSLPNVKVASGKSADFLEATAAFMRRWRLLGLPAPGLPQSLGWQQPASILPGHSADQFTIVAKPKHMPAPPNDALMQVLDDDARPSADEQHLHEWLHFVAKSNTGKQVFNRYARVFELQHFWRMLHGRHAKACTHRTGDLTAVFAKFMDCKSETLRQDLRLIRQRLGQNWFRHT